MATLPTTYSNEGFFDRPDERLHGADSRGLHQVGAALIVLCGIKIKELVDSREIEGIRDINDESAKGKTRLVIDLKRDAPALVILNNLYKRTPLQTTFSVNTVALVDGVPRTLNVVQALQAYEAAEQLAALEVGAGA